MELVRELDATPVCPGLWYGIIAPTELMESGGLIGRSDFYWTSLDSGIPDSSKTAAFNILAESILREAYEAGDISAEDLNLYSRGLRDDLVRDIFWLETQSVHDLVQSVLLGEKHLNGCGPKILDVIHLVLYDEPLLTSEDERRHIARLIGKTWRRAADDRLSGNP